MLTHGPFDQRGKEGNRERIIGGVHWSHTHRERVRKEQRENRAGEAADDSAAVAGDGQNGLLGPRGGDGRRRCERSGGGGCAWVHDVMSDSLAFSRRLREHGLSVGLRSVPGPSGRPEGNRGGGATVGKKGAAAVHGGSAAERRVRKDREGSTRRLSEREIEVGVAAKLGEGGSVG